MVDHPAGIAGTPSARRDTLTGRGIAGGLRSDFCDVYERGAFSKADGSTGFRREQIYKDLPCRISFGKTGVKLFLGNEYVINAGSVIVVRRKNFTETYRNSSPPAVYSEHQEIWLEREVLLHDK